MTLSHELDRYLSIRRSLGYDLREDQRVLRRFVAFADSVGVAHITTDLYLRWQGTFGSVKRQTRGGRFTMVRLFAQWLHGLDDRHEVPPRGLVPKPTRRPSPYIYSEAEIAAIVDEAAKLPSIYGLRGLTYSTLYGLISVTGLRISEAVGLNSVDVNLDDGVLHIRCGKFGKQRLLPLATSVVDRLHAYMTERNRLLGATPVPLFVKGSGERIGVDGAEYNFAQICQRIGLRDPQRHFRSGRGLASMIFATPSQPER